jgi:hypothetical protein
MWDDMLREFTQAEMEILAGNISFIASYYI